MAARGTNSTLAPRATGPGGASVDSVAARGTNCARPRATGPGGASVDSVAARGTNTTLAHGPPAPRAQLRLPGRARRRRRAGRLGSHRLERCGPPMRARSTILLAAALAALAGVAPGARPSPRRSRSCPPRATTSRSRRSPRRTAPRAPPPPAPASRTAASPRPPAACSPPACAGPPAATGTSRSSTPAPAGRSTARPAPAPARWPRRASGAASGSSCRCAGAAAPARPGG